MLNKRVPTFQFLVRIPMSLWLLLESSRTRGNYPPTESHIIEDGLVLKEENCLFPCGRLSCVKMTAQSQKIPSLAPTASYLWLLKSFCVPGPPWPSLLLSLPLTPAVNSLTATVIPFSAIIASMTLTPPTSICTGCRELEVSRCCERTIL